MKAALLAAFPELRQECGYLRLEARVATRLQPEDYVGGNEVKFYGQNDQAGQDWSKLVPAHLRSKVQNSGPAGCGEEVWNAECLPKIVEHGKSRAQAVVPEGA